MNFLYSPNTEGAQNKTGPSGWGAAALLNAVDEGLAGIVDEDCLYQTIAFSPRFVVTEYNELRYITGYENSRVFVDVRFIRKDDGMRYDIYSKAKRIHAHILLPKGKRCSKLFVNGVEKAFELVKVADSAYVDFVAAGEDKLAFEILFA